MNERTNKYAGLRLSAVCGEKGGQRHHDFRDFFKGSRTSRVIEEKCGSGSGREAGINLCIVPPSDETGSVRERAMKSESGYTSLPPSLTNCEIR